MYSRYEDKGKSPIRLPEHYGGSTFSQLPTEPISIPKREPPRPISREGIGEKASPIAERMMRAEVAEKESIDPAPAVESSSIHDEALLEEEEKKTPVVVEKTHLAPPFNFGALRRLFSSKEGDGGEDQDRLLLLGLILLLSRTEGDSDILLWLSLLLLCG